MNATLPTLIGVIKSFEENQGNKGPWFKMDFEYVFRGPDDKMQSEVIPNLRLFGQTANAVAKLGVGQGDTVKLTIRLKTSKPWNDKVFLEAQVDKVERVSEFRDQRGPSQHQHPPKTPASMASDALDWPE